MHPWIFDLREKNKNFVNSDWWYLNFQITYRNTCSLPCTTSSMSSERYRNRWFNTMLSSFSFNALINGQNLWNGLPILVIIYVLLNTIEFCFCSSLLSRIEHKAADTSVYQLTGAEANAANQFSRLFDLFWWCCCVLSIWHIVALPDVVVSLWLTDLQMHNRPQTLPGENSLERLLLYGYF